MNNLTRILIVEDYAPDFELAQREIRKVLKHCEFQRVHTRRGYLQALESFQPDLILSDYQLPNFDGMKALRLVRERAPLTPLIIWTGSISEDTAVECMKAGASNYVIKENRKRLGPTVLHALEERQLRVERLQAEETRRAILDNSPVGIFQSTPEGQYISVNPAMARIYGYSSPEEMIRSISDIASQVYAEPEGCSNFTKLFELQDVVEDYEWKNVRKDGTVIWTSISARAVRDTSGRIAYFEGFLQDITERKEAEEKLRASEANYRLLFENNPLPMWIYDVSTLGFLRVNEAAVQHYGYSMDEFLAMTMQDIQPPRDVHALSEHVTKDASGISGGDVWRHRKKDGTVIHVEIVSHLIEFGGRKAELVLSTDITQRLKIESGEREQRTLAEALRHTAEALSSTLDYGQVLEQILTTVESVVPSEAATIMLIDEQKAHVVRTRGYSERGMNTEVMEVELPLAETTNLWQMLETGKPVIVSDTQSYPNWKNIPTTDWLRSNVGAPICLHGEVIGFILLDSHIPGFFTPIHAERLEAFAHQAALAIHNSRLLRQAQEEIAARKRIDEALKVSEERFRLITQNAEDMIWTIDMNFLITYVSPSVERALGYTAQEILDSDPQRFLTVESLTIGLQAFKEEIQKAKRQPDPNYARLLDLEFRRKNGSTFWVETKFSLFRDRDGQPIAVLGVGRDITERKQALARLNDLHEFNEKILTHSPLGILTYKFSGECIFVNENAAAIVGATMQELKAQNFHTIPSWKESGLYELACQATQNGLAAADVHHWSSFGRDVWLQAHFVLFKSKEEDHLLLAISDITDRKLAEEKLRESESRLIMALSAAQMSVWEWNLQTNDVFWSPEFYAITGIPEFAYDGTFEGYTDLIHPEDVEHVRESAERALATDTLFASEFRIIRPDGEVRWVANLGHAEHGESDNSLRMIGTVQDITQRKQVEIERQALLDIMQGLTGTGDLQEFLNLLHRSIGNVIYADNFFVVFYDRATGLFEEIYSVDLYDPPAPPSKLEKSITSYVFRIGEPLLLDQELFEELKTRGEVELVGTNSASWLGAPLKTLNGTIGVLVVQDYEYSNRYSEHDKEFLASIANQVALALERKQAEEKVHESEERYRALFENSPISIWEEDLSRVKKYIDSLKQQGVTDFRAYFTSHPEAVAACTAMIDILDVNNAGIQMYQAKSKSELIESTLRAPCKGEEEHNHEDFIAIAEGKTSNSWEGADETITGEPLEISLKWSVAPGHEQDFSKVIVTVVDITERKRTEQKLQASEERFRQMADNIEEVFWMNDAQTGKRLYLSPAIEKIWGRSSEFLNNELDGLFNSILPEDRTILSQGLEKQRRGEKVEIEYRIFRPDGSVRWIWDRAFPVFDDHGRVKILAGIAADITARKQAEEQLNRRARETSALLETSLSLSNLDLKEILHNIGQSAKTLFNADGCRIFLMQPDGENLRCVLALQESPTAFSHLTLRLGEGVTGSVAASGRAEIVNSMQADHRAVLVPGTVEEEEEAIMFAPLKERDRTIGILSVRRIGSDRPFYPADLELLEAFASMAASAVSNARLFEETQRRLSELEALYENGLAVGQLLEPHQIGGQLIETFSRYLSWNHVAIRLLKPGTQELKLIAFNQPDLKEEDREETARRLANLISRVDQGLSGWVVKTGKPLRTGNVSEYPQYVATYSGIQAGMYMPLRMGEEVIGVISVESENPDALTVEDERLLATLANQAAVAFENARLYQAAQSEIMERKLIEEELRESQERYRLLIETSPDGVIMMNTDGTIRFSNLQMAGVFGYERPGQLLGMNFISLVAPENRMLFEQAVGRDRLNDMPQEGHWFMRQDGSRFFGELHSSALRNEKGEQYAIIAQLRDVTEKKQSQEALREERQRFLDLFENSPIPTWLEDFTAVIAWMDELRTLGVDDLREYLLKNPEEYKVGISLIRVLNVNHAAVIMNGAKTKQELIHKLHELMLDETPSHVMVDELDMIWQGNRSFGFEMSSPRLDGSLTTGILRIYIPSSNGRPDYARVIVTSTDISERVEIERKLRASELHYRELADSITDILFELDHDLRYTHWNKASEVLTGIPAHEVIGRSMYKIFGEAEEQIRIGKIYQSVVEENQSKTFETEIFLLGQKFTFEINANPSMRGVSVVARNITDRKLSEVLMQKRVELVEFAAHHPFEEVLQKTIDVASELTGSHIGFIHFIQEDQNTIHWKAWSTETLIEFCNMNGEEIHYPIDQAGVWAEAVRQRRPVIQNDYDSLADRKGMPEGHTKVSREMVIPIIRNEKIVAVMGVGNKTQEYTSHDVDIAERFADYAWDITERKQMENALAEERNQLAKRVEDRTADLSRANANLARALRVKDEFLANMSHELRTPLNAILGLSESLGEQVAGPLNEKQQKYLSTINESGHHLLALINDILDLAKIEAGQITLDINKVDVNSVCQASLRMIRQLAQKKNQEVLFEIDPDLGLMWADERRLKQMIVNLLSNAVKFTPESARIGLEVRGDRAANKVIITVWDTGIGIRDEDLERLFKPFVQLDSGLAREATGTGLGLALVAQMARLHGGSVHALSQPGAGSRFIIELPWEPAIATDMAARLRITGKFRAIDPSLRQPTILLIEDTREVVMMLVDYLEMAGYKMVTAQDGVDGLAQAKLTHPDLILMDIQMPRMDGFEATQRLRSDPEFKDIPIIALTALAMPNDRQRCLDAGMDEYISKPVNLKALTKTIHKLLSPEASPS